MNFNGNSGLASATLPYHVRVPAGQADKSAGTYSGQLLVTLRQGDSVGAVLNTMTMRTEAAVAKACAVDLALLSYSVTHQAFRPTALVDPVRGKPRPSGRGRIARSGERSMREPLQIPSAAIW